MKFMIRELGWTRWREEYERELTACRSDTPTLDIDPAPESTPDWTKAASPSVGHIAARVAAQKVSGPGITPVIAPLLQPGDPGGELEKGLVTRRHGDASLHRIT